MCRTSAARGAASASSGSRSRVDSMQRSSRGGRSASHEAGAPCVVDGSGPSPSMSPVRSSAALSARGPQSGRSASRSAANEVVTGRLGAPVAPSKNGPGDVRPLRHHPRRISAAPRNGAAAPRRATSRRAGPRPRAATGRGRSPRGRRSTSCARRPIVRRNVELESFSGYGSQKESSPPLPY